MLCCHETNKNSTYRGRTSNLEVISLQGQHMTREVNRAHILLALDQNVPEKHIMLVLGVGRTAIWRTRSAYLEKCLDYALHDAARPGQPVKYGTNQQAEVVALACSAPPKGAKRWTIALLTEAIRQQRKLRKISRESIRLFLKKTTVSLGGN